MLLPKTIYYKYEYSLDPIDEVEAIINYILGKYPNIDKIEALIKDEHVKEFKDDFSDDIKGKKEKIDNLISHLSNILSDELVKVFFEEHKDIIFINTNNKYLITRSEKIGSGINFNSVCNILVKYLKFDLTLFTSLFSKLHTNPVVIRLFISNNKISINNSIYNVNDLASNGLNKEILDEEGFLLNKETLESNLMVNVKDECVYEVNNKEGKVVGLIIDELFFPLINELFPLKSNLLGFMRRFLFDSSQDGKRVEYDNNNFKKFLEDSKKKDFIEILSHLENNLYLPYEALKDDDEFKSHFNEVYLLKELKNLDQFLYLVNTTEANKNKIILGIYSDKKIKSEYNLLHWLTLDVTSQNYNDYAGKSIPSKFSGVKRVWALNQECSYYFISSFFEDYFEDILEGEKIDYLRNRKFYYDKEKSREIDFILFLHAKIVMVECKTRLDKFNIEDTIQKTEKFYNEIPNELDKSRIEFHMVSLFYNENIRDHFSPFIKEPPGAKTVDFSFKLPSGEEMRCISSMELEKLKQIIKDL
jgi:hypothetical protein